ncbi:hypothetical protein I302_102838 [Kwoniella bestiolae CBS 10118]|uniref:Thioesterase domain-containing protein n=1 Tax=Kwoniella bestiolae CBS 10118 TaxID=1296100 RepID=A0A1B9GGD6_9TREE|nr:hypothetical protein I302_01533 [Kwoniella bestiolae CBS 10118]OCF30015.1 hypothetical protein I302_01533 [Kwoniella bestiolae CBS 10118]
MACLKFLQKAWSTTLSKGGHDSNVLSSLRLIEARPKHLKGVFKIESKHLNNHGTIHGGVILSLTDTLTSLSLSTLGFPPPTGVSVNISTEFVRPGGKEGDNLICIGTVEQCGRNLAYTRCEFYTPKSLSSTSTVTDPAAVAGGEEGGIGKLVAYGSQTKFMGGWSRQTGFSEDGVEEVGSGLDGGEKAKL